MSESLQTLEAGYYKIAYVSGWFDRFGFGQNYMVEVVVTFDGQSTTYLSTPEYSSVSALQAYMQKAVKIISC